LKDLEAKKLNPTVVKNPQYTRKTKIKDGNVLNRNVELLTNLGDLNVDYILRNNQKL
jgi:hypothetical protein